MASFLNPHLFLLICCFHVALSSSYSSSSDQSPRPYIVYMGAGSLDLGEEDMKVAESTHLQLISTVIPSEEIERVSFGHVYHHAMKGFSAMLTEREASLLSGRAEVISVFPDPILQLQTTRSWDFLNEESGFASNFHPQPHVRGSDVIIGVLDSGIWPESPSFSDKGIGEIPKRWRGVCMEGHDFKKSSCNRKLIGARYYKEGKSKAKAKESANSPRDEHGHGTHTASTAGGAHVANASYFGLARGTARGGLPSARIASYKICGSDGCAGSTMMKAFDDAVKDKVDIISLSVGGASTSQPDFLHDPIAIGAFHADQHGITVVCAAGNDGPDLYTVTNTAPWIFTVAASNIDRSFESTLILGNGRLFKGSAINFSNLTRAEQYPLVYARDVASDPKHRTRARNCFPESLDHKKVAGKIVVCDLNDDTTVSRKLRILTVQDAGAIGMIYVSDPDKGNAFDTGDFPFAQVGKSTGKQILSYVKSSKKPSATILSTTAVQRTKPAPVVAYFSSRGPASLTENVLKPDIMAPGVGILAAIIPEKNPTMHGPFVKKQSPMYSVKSGTSMACPHVSGAAAFIKSVRPEWTPSMIRSALMTTAIVADNMGKVQTNSSGDIANPHEAGAGNISPIRALYPGLVFPTTQEDYLRFLCYYGFSWKEIRKLSHLKDLKFKFPKKSSEGLITNINYPSISIAKIRRGHSKKVLRHVMNVGSPNDVYTVSVDAPKGLRVRVKPKKIAFKENLSTSCFNVTFIVKQAKIGYNYGSLTWSHGKHTVRVVFAVNVVE